jgi:hypothetical protein
VAAAAPLSITRRVTLDLRSIPILIGIGIDRLVRPHGMFVPTFNGCPTSRRSQ